MSAHCIDSLTLSFPSSDGNATRQSIAALYKLRGSKACEMNNYDQKVLILCSFEFQSRLRNAFHVFEHIIAPQRARKRRRRQEKPSTNAHTYFRLMAMWTSLIANTLQIGQRAKEMKQLSTYLLLMRIHWNFLSKVCLCFSSAVRFLFFFCVCVFLLLLLHFSRLSSCILLGFRYIHRRLIETGKEKDAKPQNWYGRVGGRWAHRTRNISARSSLAFSRAVRGAHSQTCTATRAQSEPHRAECRSVLSVDLNEFHVQTE